MLSVIIADFELNLLWDWRFHGVGAIVFVAGGENEVRANSLQRKSVNKVILKYALDLFFDR